MTYNLIQGGFQSNFLAHVITGHFVLLQTLVDTPKTLFQFCSGSHQHAVLQWRRGRRESVRKLFSSFLWRLGMYNFQLVTEIWAKKIEPELLGKRKRTKVVFKKKKLKKKSVTHVYLICNVQMVTGPPPETVTKVEYVWGGWWAIFYHFCLRKSSTANTKGIF